MRKRVCLLWIALFASCCFALAAEAQSCPAQLHLNGKVRRYTGRYVNRAFGFSTQLPGGLAGLDADDPSYQRGFAVALPKDQGTVWVFAESNSADFGQPQAAAEAAIHYLGTRAEHMLPANYVKEKIASHPAERVSAEFQCAGSKERFGYTAIMAMDTDRRFVYSIVWEGRLIDSNSADTILQSLQSSWRFLVPR